MDVLAEALRAHRLGGAVFCRGELRAPWGLRFPAGPGAAFHLVARGECWIVPDVGSPTHLEEGDLVLLPHGDGHVLSDELDRPFVPYTDLWGPGSGVLTLDGGGEPAELICGGYALDAGARTHPVLSQLPSLVVLRTVAASSELTPLTALLTAELHRVQPGGDALINSLMDAIFVMLLRAWLADRPPGLDGWLGGLADPGVARTLAAIHTSPADRWTVGNLARTAGMSRSVYASRFRDLVGAAPLAYVTQWRIALACRALRESGEPLAIIAERVGYGSSYALSKAFRKHIGESPGRYRLRNAS